MSLTAKQTANKQRLEKALATRVDEFAVTYDEIGADDINYGDIAFELQEATQFVLLAVENKLIVSLAKRVSSPDIVYDKDKDCLFIIARADILKFIRLRVNGHKTSINYLVDQSNKLYELQQYKLSRATKERPIGFHSNFYDKVTRTAPQGQVVAVMETGDIDDVSIDDVVSDGQDSGTVISIDVLNGHVFLDDTDADFVKDTSLTVLGGGTYVVKTITASHATSNSQDYSAFAENDYAIEAYPAGEKSVEEFSYLPKIPFYDIPSMFEDAILWDATYRLLDINERSFADKAMFKRDRAIEAMNRGF